MTRHLSTRELPPTPSGLHSRVEPFPSAIPTCRCPHQLHEGWFVAEPDQQPAGDVAGGKLFGGVNAEGDPLLPCGRWRLPRHPFRIG